MKTKINQQQLNEYLDVFGSEKMLFLWHEFVAQAEQTWGAFPHMDWEQRRRAFHNWRNGGRIFGLDDFADLCQSIEDQILRRHMQNLEARISECRSLYRQGITEVLSVLQKKDTDNG